MKKVLLVLILVLALSISGCVTVPIKSPNGISPHETGVNDNTASNQTSSVVIVPPHETGVNDNTTSNQTISVDTNSNSDNIDPDDSTFSPDTSTSENGNYLLYFTMNDGTENNLNDFSNGMTVDLVLKTQNSSGSDSIYIAIINTNGEIIYKLDTGMDSSASKIDYEIIHIGKNLVSFRYHDAYYLVNSSGKEILNTQDGIVDKVIGSGDDNALVYRRTADFASWDELVGVINYDGQWTLPLESAKDYILYIPENGDGYKDQNFIEWGGGFSECVKAEYIGETYYALYYDYRSSGQYINIFSYNSKRLLHVSSAPEQMTMMKNGKAYAYIPDVLGYRDLRAEAIKTIDYSNLTWYSTIKPDAYWEYEVHSILKDRMILEHYDGRMSYFDSIVPEFYTLVQTDDGGTAGYICGDSFGKPFNSLKYSDGYYIATMTGSDGKSYFAFLDEQMDAISTSQIYTYKKIVSFENGKILYIDYDDNYKLAYPNGIVSTVAFKPENDNSEIMGFHDGIARIGRYYETWQSKSEKANRYINEKGEIIFSELTDKS